MKLLRNQLFKFLVFKITFDILIRDSVVEIFYNAISGLVAERLGRLFQIPRVEGSSRTPTKPLFNQNKVKLCRSIKMCDRIGVKMCAAESESKCVQSTEAI